VEGSQVPRDATKIFSTRLTRLPIWLSVPQYKFSCRARLSQLGFITEYRRNEKVKEIKSCIMKSPVDGAQSF